MSDEHNPRFSSVYGHPFVQTPNMERIARMGCVYENAYCPSPLCAPSRSAFVSGRRVHDIKAYSNCTVFRSHHPSYGRILRYQGVHSVHIGKMDAYNRTPALGFSEAMLAGDRDPPGDTNISRHPLAIRAEAASRADGYGPVEGNPFAYDDAVIGAATTWLGERAPALDCPWALVVNIGKPHFPHYVTPELWDAYADRGDLPEHGPEAESARHPFAVDLRAHFQTSGFTEAQIRGLRRGYYGCVTHVDRLLGRLLDALESAGLLSDTVFVYTSDHGEMLGKFGMWWKCSLYEDSVRVPLIVAGPGFPAGARVRTPVDLHDLQASIFAAVGAERPEEWVGEPLQSIPVDDPSRAVFSEYHGHGTHASGFVLRRGSWKYIHCCEAPHQLFHLGDDPEEVTNLAQELPEVRSELEAELRAICSPESENAKAAAYIRRQLLAVARISAATS